MSEYSSKLAAIAAKKEKLLKEENKLIERRKKEIANSAERLGLLTASDELITGLFLEAVNAIKENQNRIKEWETQGERFLKSKKHHTEAA
jgi:hypothetical protein